MSKNTYTSNLLCHFVGRSKKTDDERFELLVTIIKGKRLIANLANPTKPESFFESGSQCEHVGEVFGKCDCVCFCDIPNESLDIHTKKYSKFGMGFEKGFIACQGAHPVMYVPKNYPVVERGDGSRGQTFTPKQPESYFPYILQVTTNLLILMELGYSVVDMQGLKECMSKSPAGLGVSTLDSNITKDFFEGKRIPMINSILQGIGTQMAYVKLYDATLSDDHPDNYYMEREWRSLNNISFSINDIKTIYVPSVHYQDKFVQEFPDYVGDFVILGDSIGG